MAGKGVIRVYFINIQRGISVHSTVSRRNICNIEIRRWYAQRKNKLITLVEVEIMCLIYLFIICKSRHNLEIQIADKISQHSAGGIVIRCYHNMDLFHTDRTNCDCCDTSLGTQSDIRLYWGPRNTYTVANYRGHHNYPPADPGGGANGAIAPANQKNKTDFYKTWQKYEKQLTSRN